MEYGIDVVGAMFATFMVGGRRGMARRENPSIVTERLASAEQLSLFG
ncbi:MAG: hypothetical protein IT475_05620 [Aquimonas sp.]|nr:hypothetical protein [Aquimonas sp.]